MSGTMEAISLMDSPLNTSSQMMTSGRSARQRASLQALEVAGGQAGGGLVGHVGFALKADLFQDVHGHGVPGTHAPPAAPAAGAPGPWAEQRHDEVFVGG